MNKAPINVQDSFFYNLRKDNVPVTVRLTSGEERMGRLRRFDKFALVLEVEGREEMIYKHAIRYMFKEEELRQRRRRNREAEAPPSAAKPGTARQG